MRRQVHFYQQIKNELIQKIRQGDYKPDEMLPSESDLMRHYSVSSITVRRALSDLVHTGLIYRKQGVGSFVSDIEKQLKTYRIGLVFSYARPNFGADYYAASLFHALSAELADRGHSLLIFTDKDDGYRRLREEDADGFILLCSDDRDRKTLEDLKRSGVPLVILGACWDDSDLACISIENTAGVRSTLSHFAEAGYKNLGLAHIDALYFPDHRERVEAFYQIADEMGFSFHKNNRVLSGSLKVEPLKKYEEYLCSLPKPVGVLATDARLAAKLFHAACRTGLQIPEEVAIIAFDELPREDEIPLPLSIIRQPLAAMAHRAVLRLMEALTSHQLPAGPERFPIEFIHRHSCCLLPMRERKSLL